MIAEVVEQTKWCSGCERDLPVSAFHRSKATGDGFQTRCTECRKAYKSSESDAVYQRNYHDRNRDRRNAERSERDRQDRLAALCHYSGGDPKCACCGEREIAFLALDHIDGGGNKHRREAKATNLGRWLRTHGWPEGFRVLCHNCNFAHGAYGECPHQREGVKLALV